jgi:hypothetical protein
MGQFSGAVTVRLMTESRDYGSGANHAPISEFRWFDLMGLECEWVVEV